MGKDSGVKCGDKRTFVREERLAWWVSSWGSAPKSSMWMGTSMSLGEKEKAACECQWHKHKADAAGAVDGRRVGRRVGRLVCGGWVGSVLVVAVE